MQYGIHYPDNYSEAEIQFMLHSRLLALGYDSRLEVTERKNVKKAFGNRKGFRQCRFDCVIFNDKQALCIVEVKKNKESSFTRQNEKYRIYGLPLVYLFGVNDLEGCISRIKESLPCRL